MLRGKGGGLQKLRCLDINSNPPFIDKIFIFIVFWPVEEKRKKKVVWRGAPVSAAELLSSIWLQLVPEV